MKSQQGEVRRLILSRALIAGAAGLIPVPYIDDLLAGGVRSSLIRRIAERRNVDVDENAVAYLSTPNGSRLLNVASIGALVLVGTKKAWKKIAGSFLFVRRLDEAIQTYQVGMLFDRYCTKHHVGAGLTGDHAALLRQLMDHTTKQVRSTALEAVFRRVLRLPGQAALKLWPFNKTGGPTETPSDPPSDPVEEKVQSTESTHYAHKLVDELDSELTGVERAYLEQLYRVFDDGWAQLKEKAEAHAAASRAQPS